MKRFHFKNNKELDSKIYRLKEKFICSTLSDLFNKKLFKGVREFLNFMNFYCYRNTKFKNTTGCNVSRKVSIPFVVYYSMKLCHDELDTFSIAFIWRSMLLDIVDCFERGGLEEWERFKMSVIDSGKTRDKNQAKDNELLLDNLSSVHIPGLIWQNISKIVFFTLGNQYMGHLRQICGYL